MAPTVETKYGVSFYMCFFWLPPIIPCHSHLRARFEHVKSKCKEILQFRRHAVHAGRYAAAYHHSGNVQHLLPSCSLLRSLLPLSLSSDAINAAWWGARTTTAWWWWQLTTRWFHVIHVYQRLRHRFQRDQRRRWY